MKIWSRQIRVATFNPNGLRKANRGRNPPSSILCWKSILPFVEIALPFQLCFHCCTNFTSHNPTTSCINEPEFVSVVFRQHVNCSVDLTSACFLELTFLEAEIVCKYNFFFFVIPNSWNKCALDPPHVDFFIHPGISGNTHQPSCHTFLSPQWPHAFFLWR